ncbi:MAG: carboxypeptidase-like regulatory domain-containing protein [Balneolaceae bacterium]|nr:carboxypeptidase-like regulatory domain-containing protein [Balneolaceae bacterium]
MKKLYTSVPSIFAIGLVIILLNPVTGVTANQNGGSIEGKITNSKNEPLAGVNIALPQLNRGTISENDGTFRIADVPTGRYTIVFSFVGYSKVNRKVTVERDETAYLEVTLQEQTLETETITVTGTPYASDPLTTPTDVDVLAGKNKLSTQQTSLGDSIDQLAGVTTIQTGSQTGKPVIRGLSGSRVRVLDDGTPMEYQQYGVRHAPNVDPFTAERIEVVRGASNVQYGSDAIGGAVNIISGSIPQALDRDNFVRGQTLAEYSTNNSELAAGVHLEGASGGFGWSGSIIRRAGSNMHAPDVPTFRETDDTEAPKFSGELNNTDFDQVNGSIGIGYSIRNWDVNTEFTHWQNEHNFMLPNGKGLGQYLQNDVLNIEGSVKPGNNWVIDRPLPIPVISGSRARVGPMRFRVII